jgi:hypothetical protein
MMRPLTPLRIGFVATGAVAGAPPVIDIDQAAKLIVRTGCDAASEAGTVLHVVGAQAATARALAVRIARVLCREAPMTPYRLRAADARFRFDCTRTCTALGCTSDFARQLVRGEAVA